MKWFGAAEVSTDDVAVQTLLTRGVENVIPRELGLKKLQSGQRLRIYLGIDPTGAKLHLGHSVPLRKLKSFADLGHEVVFLVGSFTAMIGDPTGRDAMRAPLTRGEIEENFKDYKRQAGKVLDFSKVEIRYNHEWLDPLKFGDIVQLASNFTVQQMLQRDMFDKRLKEGKPISVHEFLYPLMVGYDSVALDVDCELGGSDQEFNMLAGRTLQQAFGKREKFVLTTRLIEGTDGRKMSKTYDNCVYLEDAPSDMYGKLMSIRDELVRTYYEVLTDVPMGEIEAALAGHPKEAKMRLAREIVTMYHDADAAAKAEENFEKTFSKGEVPDDVQEIESKGLLRETLVQNGIVSSNSEFARLALAGAIRRIDGNKEIKIISAKAPAPEGSEFLIDSEAQVNSGQVFRIGKHRIVKIK
jgi:tyrosyl-tRNA synthetase